MNTCIWRKQLIAEASEEHVIPDALGRPQVTHDGPAQASNHARRDSIFTRLAESSNISLIKS